MTEEWKTLDSDKKQTYEAMSQAEKKRYE